jgi:hypothetical protein
MNILRIDGNAWLRRFGWAGVAFAVLAWTGGCSSDSEVLGPPALPTSPFIVSDPVAGVGPSAAGGESAGPLESNGATGVVFVSLPAGGIPAGTSASIRNRATGASVSTPVVAGGFDPVPIEASTGDTLDIVVALGSGSAPLSYMKIVPEGAPPIVVRTEPTAGKRDVPLNAIIVIAFSEPIDAATLTGTSIQLRRGAEVVPGAVHVVGEAQLLAEFVPDEALAPGSDYVLIVTQDIRDQDNDGLAAAVSVSFTTAVLLPLPHPRFAFVSNRDGTDQIYVANADGSGVTRLTNGYYPAWSPDGRRIAFERWVPSLLSAAGVYVMNADGTGVTWLADGVNPAWSPDGSRIAFGNRGLEVINADGSGLGTLISNGVVPVPLGDDQFLMPAWSPDGQSIAFVVTHQWDSPTQIYVMHSDGSNLRPLAHVDDMVLYSKRAPAWSPDGSRIAYSTADWCNTGPVTQDLCSPDRSAVVAETLSGTDDKSVLLMSDWRHPAGNADWSPDGLSLAFEMVTEPGVESTRIFLVTPATGEVRRIIPDAVAPAKQDYSDRDVSWSRGMP